MLWSRLVLVLFTDMSGKGRRSFEYLTLVLPFESMSLKVNAKKILASLGDGVLHSLLERIQQSPLKSLSSSPVAQFGGESEGFSDTRRKRAAPELRGNP